MGGSREMAGICWALVRAGLREEMQFRANFLVEVAFGLVYQTIGFAFIWVVLGKFQAIGGWTLQEVTLLYGIQLMGMPCGRWRSPASSMSRGWSRSASSTPCSFAPCRLPSSSCLGDSGSRSWEM